MTNKENSMKTKQMFFILLLDVVNNNLKFKNKKQARREKKYKTKGGSTLVCMLKESFRQKGHREQNHRAPILPNMVFNQLRDCTSEPRYALMQYV